MLVETPDAKMGSHAPSFSLPDLDGETVTLKSALGTHGLVVAFICNHCPYVKAIADELAADAAALKALGVNTVAIMSNDYETYRADSPENMKRFAAAHSFGFPYLLDQTQAVARAYGAVCTPDFFGYDREGKLRYRGRLDNGTVKRPADREPELLNAMRQVAETGTGPSEQRYSIGCSIKWRGDAY